MKARINNKEYNLTEQELEFVRQQIGEWEVYKNVFEKPLYISITEMVSYFNISKQAVHDKAKRHGIEVLKDGGKSFISFDDVQKFWF